MFVVRFVRNEFLHGRIPGPVRPALRKQTMFQTNGYYYTLIRLLLHPNRSHCTKFLKPSPLSLFDL